MAKRQTHLEKAIANLDEKIGALQLARQHLVEQQTSKPATRKPRVVSRPSDDRSVDKSV